MPVTQEAVSLELADLLPNAVEVWGLSLIKIRKFTQVIQPRIAIDGNRLHSGGHTRCVPNIDEVQSSLEIGDAGHILS